MSDDFTLITPKEFEAKLPPAIKRPCDYSLTMAVSALETQLGSIEAYNRMVQACAELKEKIDSGNAEPQNELYRTSPCFAK